MRRYLFLLPLLTILVILSSFKTLKEAYQEEGISIYGETHWAVTDMPVKYSINERGSADVSGDAEFTAINNAFTSWTGAVCNSVKVNLRVEYLGKTAERVGYFDGKNTIDFVESRNEWPPEAGASAIAFTLPNIRADGIIIEADLRFNGVNYTWSTSGGYNRMDVQTIALHELGHFFGLADLYDNYSCYTAQVVMCGYGGTGTKRSLKQDDINGICYLYDPEKYYECSREADCKDGFVCKPYINLENRTTTLCLEPHCVPASTNDPYCNNMLNTKATDPGKRCGDVNNTPLNVGDDIYCKNQLCLNSMICSAVCQTDTDCPKNMKCEEITVKTDENINVTLKGCNTPPGCKSNRGCPQNQACVPYLAGSTIISVCNDYIGTADVGESCTKNTDCKTGICYNNYCSAFCTLNNDCTVYGNDYMCSKDISITYGGLTDRFYICTRAEVIADAGIDILTDGSTDTVVQDALSDIILSDFGFDAGTDAAFADRTVIDTTDARYDVSIIDTSTDKDKGSLEDYANQDIEGECLCDQTYNCDPDCDCDPECLDVIEARGGCSCSTLY